MVTDFDVVSARLKMTLFDWSNEDGCKAMADEGRRGRLDADGP